MGKLPSRLKETFNLSDEDKAEILASFDEDIRSLAERIGYVNWNWDVIANQNQHLI